MTEQELNKFAADAAEYAEKSKALTGRAHMQCKVCDRWYHTDQKHICIGDHNEHTINEHCDAMCELMDSQFRKGVLHYESITGLFESHDADWYLEHALQELADLPHYMLGLRKALAKKDAEINFLKSELDSMKKIMEGYEAKR